MAKEFRIAADRSLAVWRSDGALDGMVNLGPVELPAQAALGINQVDTLTHSWDLCVALGVDRSIDPALAEAVFAVAQMITSDETAVTGSHPQCRSPTMRRPTTASQRSSAVSRHDRDRPVPGGMAAVREPVLLPWRYRTPIGRSAPRNEVIT